MKNFKFFLLIGLIISMLIIPKNVVYASESANPSAEMIPKLEDLYNYKDNKYFTDYKGNYYLDLKDVVIKGQVGKFLNGGANVLFELEVLLTQVLAAVIYYTFELSIFDLFSGPIDTIVKNLKIGIFDEFALVCISFIGIYYIFKMIKNQKTQVLMTMAKMICILVLALVFFRQPTAMLKGVDSLSKGIGQAALEGTYKATMDGKSSSSATESITTNLWLMFVHKPWQVLEFGSTSMAEEYEDEILRLSPDSDERQDIINEIAEDDVHFQPNLGLKRLGIMILYFAIFIVLAAVIIAFCFLIIGYQFLMLIYAIAGPLALLLALIPSFGFNTVKSWGGKIIGYGSMKAVLSLIIAVLFSFLISTYELTDKYGILMVSLIQIALLGIVWYKRESLLDGFLKFASATKEIPSAQSLNRAFRQDMSIENGIRDWNRRRQQLRDKNNNEYYETTTGESNKSSNSPYNKSQKSQKGNNRDFNKGYHEFESGRENRVDGNLNESRKIAEEILEERYRNLKHQSEDRAQALGKDPEYSNWVKTVMNREEMNLPKFDEREKQAVVNQIKWNEARGINIKDIEGVEEKEDINKYIKRPSGIEVDRPSEVEVIEQPKKLSNREASMQYVNTFNSTFDKGYNNEFMESLVTSYGQENVGTVINDMVRINEQNKIKNPAGYLMKSLNNNKQQNTGSFNNEMSFKSNNIQNKINGENKIKKPTGYSIRSINGNKQHGANSFGKDISFESGNMQNSENKENISSVELSSNSTSSGIEGNTTETISPKSINRSKKITFNENSTKEKKVMPNRIRVSSNKTNNKLDLKSKNNIN
ncbi:CD3337/EF1877 family mobilome membrane protein [Clostridium sulfidigenes]|uniref:CD3337/EF1877 family mobilome membrane protein n=1 Tax=Clostridium sulfidigenes TaxID=318464 RepID=UPI003F8988EC